MRLPRGSEDHRCGFFHTARVVDVLRGQAHTEFLASVPLAPGQQFLIALEDAQGLYEAAQTAAVLGNQVDTLECWRRFPIVVSSWAKLEEPGGAWAEIGMPGVLLAPDVLVNSSGRPGFIRVDALREFLEAE